MDWQLVNSRRAVSNVTEQNTFKMAPCPDEQPPKVLGIESLLSIMVLLCRQRT
jgi:hypothetical protein